MENVHGFNCIKKIYTLPFKYLYLNGPGDIAFIDLRACVMVLMSFTCTNCYIISFLIVAVINVTNLLKTPKNIKMCLVPRNITDMPFRYINSQVQ